MSAYLGDFRTGKVVRKMWNSTAIAGESITRATNGTISVYKDGGTTQSTTGVTDTEDFDSLTGVHLVAVDTSADGTFYSAGSDFEVVLSAATIDGKTINATLFSFSLENRSALMPTTDGRKLDVTAAGEAGIDWANIGSPTTAVNLSGTTVKTATDVETDTADIQSRLPAALVGGRMDANMGAISSDATAADNLEAALDGTGGVTITAALTGNITGNLSGSVGSVTGAVGSVTGNVGGNVTGSIGSLATQAKADVQAEAEEALQTYHLDHLIASADPGSVVADSSFLAKLTSKSATPSFASYNNQTDSHEALRDRGDAAWITATGFSTHSAADVWSVATRALTDKAGFSLSNAGIDALFVRQLVESYAAAGAAPTLAEFMFAIHQHMQETSIAGTTATTKKLDGSTPAMTFTLDDATSPTSIERAT